MSDIAIRVENLSKQYEIDSAKRGHDTLRDLLADGLKTVFSRNGAHRQRKLTGRENIYLNGASLGMKKAEIDRNFDAPTDLVCDFTVPHRTNCSRWTRTARRRSGTRSAGART